MATPSASAMRNVLRSSNRLIPPDSRQVRPWPLARRVLELRRIVEEVVLPLLVVAFCQGYVLQLRRQHARRHLLDAVGLLQDVIGLPDVLQGCVVGLVAQVPHAPAT